MLILPRYNDIFGYFTAISHRYIGSLDRTIPRYNDLIPLLPQHIVISGFSCKTDNKFNRNTFKLNSLSHKVINLLIFLHGI